MKKSLSVIFIILLIALIINFYKISWLTTNAQSEDCYVNLEAIERCLPQLQKALEQSISATKPLESELNRLQNQIKNIKDMVVAIEEELIVRKKNIEDGYETLAQKETVLESTIRDFYIKSYYNSPLLLFLSSDSYSNIIKVLAYQEGAVDKDKITIANIVLYIQDLKTREENLKNEQARLASVKANLDKESAKLDEIIVGAKAYQSVLSGQIAQLTARQQEILSAKSGTFTTSVGDVPLPDDPNASPNYNPGFSPAFAAFSFGAYTHRKGMSQYGAKGRADSGQNYIEILKTYYGKEPVSKDTGGDILVQGFGSMNFEDWYLLGIAEMPSSWNMEALKAQAIAARTYAYRYKQNGQSICTTEACQVFLSSKANSVSADQNHPWGQAVRDTRGQVIEDVVTFYSSTTGGYITTMGWDTTSNNRDTWTSGAYEKIAASPWFYKGWYTQGYRIDSAKCGHSHPWLNIEEMSDILNAYLIQNKSGVDNGRITPITTSCWGGNPYSMDEARNLADSVGGGKITSISAVSVIYSNDGTTASVTFGTNRGDISISGSDFKQIFNLRAPGYISIKSPLYNMERK